jgi:hypothetical protein
LDPESNTLQEQHTPTACGGVVDYAVSTACGQISLDAMMKDSRQNLGFAAENFVPAILIGTKIRA